MEAYFNVAVEPSEDLIRLTMGGFFDQDAIGRMRSAIIMATAELECGPGEHKTLCDIREMKIQSQDSVTLFQKLVGSDPIRSKFLAFVTGASLARLQARRLTDRDGVKFFTDMIDAETWLRGAAD